jgi:WD40 repeat protein
MKHFLVSGERASLVVGVFVGLSLSFLVVREFSRASSLFINETIECVFSGSSVDTKTNEPELEVQNRIVTGVLSLSFSPNNKSVAIATYPSDGGVSLMKVSDQSKQKLTNESTTAVAFSPNGKWIAHSNGLNAPLGILDAFSGKNRTLASPTESSIYSLAYAPNNKWITTGHKNGSVYLWNTANDKVRLLGRSETGDIDIVTFSPDSRFVSAGGDDLKVHLWDIETGEDRVLGSHPNSNEIFGLSFSPDGKFVASVASNDTASPCLWEVKTAKGKCFGNERNVGNPYAVAFAPDGKSFVVGWSQGLVVSYNPKDGKSTTLIKSPIAIYSVAFSPDGKLLATGDPRGAKLWDAKTGKALSATSPSAESGLQDTVW